MQIKSLLRKVAKEFNLKLDSNNKFKFLILTKREIIIRNFLGGCPDPLYVKHGNKLRNKRPDALIRYLKSEDYKKDVKSPHACVISKGELNREKMLAFKITNKPLKKETLEMYNKIEKKIGNSHKLTLVWRPSKKEKNSHWRNEIILHEFVHELLEDNNIRPKSWKWNEGLVTYITHFVLGKHKKFEKSPPLGKSKMWNIYARYTHKWAKLLRGVNDPKVRIKIILKKIKEVNRK